MRYILDTDICSYIIREHPLQVIEKYDSIVKNDPESVYISAIACSELSYGALLKPSMMPPVEAFIRKIPILSWDEEASRHYADIRMVLKKQGKPVETHDMQIAAHARSIGATVVTNNIRHFKEIPGILIQNWAK